MIEIEFNGHYGQFIKCFLRKIEGDKAVIDYANDLSLEETIKLSENCLLQKSEFWQPIVGAQSANRSASPS